MPEALRSVLLPTDRVALLQTADPVRRLDRFAERVHGVARGIREVDRLVREANGKSRNFRSELPDTVGLRACA